MSDPRRTSAYQRQRRTFLARPGLSCHWCGRPVTDQVAKAHPSKATVDHLIEVGKHPQLALDASLWVVACWGCNSSRGARYAASSQVAAAGLGESSRDW